MPKEKIDYTKPEVIKRFRQLADEGLDWYAEQDKILAGMSCLGIVPEPNPECPKAPRRAKEGTSLNRVQLRHCLRDICKSVGWLKECSAKQMDAAWRDRRDAQEELNEFFPSNRGRGRYHDLRQNIERLKTARERVGQFAALDDQKRRLELVADEASHRFSLIEDIRFRFDECRLTYAGSFSEVSTWSPPTPRDLEDTRRRVDIEIAAVDWDEVGFDGKRVFIVEVIGGAIFGDRVNGLLYFTNAALAGRFADEYPRECCVNEITLAADALPSLLSWYVDKHRFTASRPDGGLFLNEQFPELVNIKAKDTSELDEALEAATARSAGW